MLVRSFGPPGDTVAGADPVAEKMSRNLLQKVRRPQPQPCSCCRRCADLNLNPVLAAEGAPTSTSTLFLLLQKVRRPQPQPCSLAAEGAPTSTSTLFSCCRRCADLNLTPVLLLQKVRRPQPQPCSLAAEGAPTSTSTLFLLQKVRRPQPQPCSLAAEGAPTSTSTLFSCCRRCADLNLNPVLLLQKVRRPQPQPCSERGWKPGATTFADAPQYSDGKVANRTDMGFRVGDELARPFLFVTRATRTPRNFGGCPSWPSSRANFLSPKP
jgi:hypothetical protein